MKTIIYRNDSDKVRHLIQSDPQLKRLFELKDEIVVPIDRNYFVSLVGTIIAQQLSSKVARVLFQRLDQACDHDITPEKILNFDAPTLRGMGLSAQKQTYLKSLSQCVLDGSVHFDDVEHMSNPEVIDMLIKIKGIGVWSAEMFLMFSLGREDVFSVGDLGLRNAVKRLYENPDLTHKDILDITQKWSPYRSIVSHFLWHAWDNA